MFAEMLIDIKILATNLKVDNLLLNFHYNLLLKNIWKTIKIYPLSAAANYDIISHIKTKHLIELMFAGEIKLKGQKELKWKQ